MRTPIAYRNHEVRLATNLEAADDPRVGDLWVEFGPSIEIVAVPFGRWVFARMLNAHSPDEIRVFTRSQFADYIRYDSIPSKTWCDVARADPGQPSAFRLAQAAKLIAQTSWQRAVTWARTQTKWRIRIVKVP